MFVLLYYNGRTSRASLQIVTRLVTRQAILLSSEYVELPLRLIDLLLKNEFRSRL